MSSVNIYSRLIKGIFGCFWVICCAVQAKHSDPSTRENRVHYPTSQSTYDHRVDYPLKLLNLALSKRDNNYELSPFGIGIPQGRALQLLKQEDGLDVVWTMTNKQREKEFLPVRIPIYKGLSGWRLLLIKQQKQAAFRQIFNLNDLRQFIAGQGHDWPDTEILRSNGVSVQSTANYESLFSMLHKERFDFFPRMVTEIWQEVEKRPQFNFIVEDSLLLHYPTATYFFVKKMNTKLAEDIEKGLNIAIADGSFNVLFYTFYKDKVEKSKLAQRRMINLTNTLLPPLTPLNRAELWYEL